MSRKRTGQPPLHPASFRGHAEIVRTPLVDEHGADAVSAQHHPGSRPDPSVILLENDADLGADATARWTGTGRQRCIGRGGRVRAFGARCGRKDELTPLRMALGGRHGKVACLFLRNGAPDAGAQDIMHHVSYRFRDNIYWSSILKSIIERAWSYNSV